MEESKRDCARVQKRKQRATTSEDTKAKERKTTGCDLTVKVAAT